MIITEKLTKKFGDCTAVNAVSTEMHEGAVFGLIGSNGAGKSTFLRMLAGVLKPDGGLLTIDGENVWENPAVKSRCFFISDEPYFFKNATPETVKKFYAIVYPKFDCAQFDKLISAFELPPKKRLSEFSKGMKKQVMIIAALASNCDYLFCDETFDGLDPVARQAVKGIFAAGMVDRKLTPVIASHNLRELEDICDRIGLLHKGGILFEQELDAMKLGIHKVQCAFDSPKTRADFPDADGFKVMKFTARGAMVTMTVKGTREKVLERVNAMAPLFAELLPLSLEEIFISETEVCGYDIKDILF